MFHCSDRAIKNLKVEVKELREARAKQTEQKRRRAESARRRRGVSNEKDVNECPRCGISLAELEDQDEMDHLQNCNDDEGKISANKRKKEALEGAKSQKRQRQELQDDVAAKAGKLEFYFSVSLSLIMSLSVSHYFSLHFSLPS